jgi:LuxR family maltose regulon positive regulatory protein
MGIRLVLRDFPALAELDARMVPGWRRDLNRLWIEIVAGRPEAAAAIIDAIEDDAVTPRQRLDIALANVRIAVERQSSDVAAHAIQAFELGESTGAILRIAEDGVDVLQHVWRVARQRPRTDYVDRLLATRPLARPVNQATPMYGIEELSAREVIILRYIATSMSYQEIAESLYLSLNTVKTHVKHVLRKLSASSRAEAVRRAQELHYL